MVTEHGTRVLLVSPNHNYAEVLSKQGNKLTVRAGCGQEFETTLAEFEKLGAVPVSAERITKANGEVIYLSGAAAGIDIYAGGEYYPATSAGRRSWR